MEGPGKRRRQKFLPDEDIKLRGLVAQYGTTAWDLIAAQLPGRNPRQCRERWKHYLSGERTKAPWSYEEDRLLFEKMQSLGPKWTRLATFFPGRTDIDMKTHWMQTFAHASNLHIRNRTTRLPPFVPTRPPAPAPMVANGHVQFAPVAVAAPVQPNRQLIRIPPRDPTPQTRFEWWAASRDPSFGSRSFFDFGEFE
jgi:hypothetical protein